MDEQAGALVAVKGDHRWYILVEAVRDKMEPEISASYRERVVNIAADIGATPIMALYWFHDQNGNLLFRHAGPYYDALDPQK